MTEHLERLEKEPTRKNSIIMKIGTYLGWPLPDRSLTSPVQRLPRQTGLGGFGRVKVLDRQHLWGNACCIEVLANHLYITHTYNKNRMRFLLTGDLSWFLGSEAPIGPDGI